MPENLENPQIIIRLCREEDLEQVAALYRLWEEEQITRGLMAESIDKLRQKLGEFFWVAARGETVLGFAVASEHEARPNEMIIFAEGARYLEVDDLYVAPTARNEGVGTRLVEALMNAARHRGIEHFLVYSSSKDWRRVTEFYERLGLQMWFVRLFK